MKRTFLVVCACMFLIGVPEVHAEELRFTIRADWMFSLRAGIEYRFNRYLGFQSSIGTNTQLLVGNLTLAVFALPSESEWQLKFLLGVPNAGIPFTFDGGFVTLGGSLAVSYRLKNDIAIEFQIGEGFPFFFEEGTKVIRDIKFPFNLWPDLALGVSFPLGNR